MSAWCMQDKLQIQVMSLTGQPSSAESVLITAVHASKDRLASKQQLEGSGTEGLYEWDVLGANPAPGLVM